MSSRYLFDPKAIDEFNANWKLLSHSCEESQNRYRGMPKRKKAASDNEEQKREFAADWHRQWVALWPPDLVAALWQPTGASHEADVLIQFLDEDPYFFRSGYAKEIAAKRLKRMDLNARQRKAIGDVCIKRVHGETRREFRALCHLAYLPNNLPFMNRLRELLDHQSYRVRLHALWMTEARAGRGGHGPEFLGKDRDDLKRLEAARAFLDHCISFPQSEFAAHPDTKNRRPLAGRRSDDHGDQSPN